MTLTLTLVFAIIIAAFDQIIKSYVYRGLAPDGKINVIDNLFSIVYVENRGVAFGMFQNMAWLFSVITIVLIWIFIFMIVMRKFKGKLFLVSSILIIGGGIGNLIDRVFRGFVIDYLSLSFFSPVCNLADYCITVGAVLFVISLLFCQGSELKNGSKQEAVLQEAKTDTSADGSENE